MQKNRTQAVDSRKSGAPDTRTQAEKFVDLARELECDEDETAFKDRMKRVAQSAKSKVAEGRPNGKKT